MRRQVSASTGLERRPHEVVQFNGKLRDWYVSEIGQRGSERLGLSVRHKPCELRAVSHASRPSAPSRSASTARMSR
jgi:hypothetical protein